MTVTPFLGPSPNRGVFTGSVISFTSSPLLHQPGNTGLKVLRVSLTNRWGVPIDVLPNGSVTGLRVVFSPFTNVGAFLDLRPLVQVSTLAGTGVSSSNDGPSGSATFRQPIGIAVD